MDEDAIVSRSRIAHRLAFACKVAAMASLLACAPPLRGMAGAVILVGPLALAPAGYLTALFLAAISIGLALASRVARPRGTASVGGAALSAETPGGRLVRWLANGAACVALLASVSIAGFECLLAAPYVADPVGPAGDRVVVVERNVLLAGHGDVYLVSSGCGLGRKIASYSADDGYSPMGNGTYVLEWDGSDPCFTALGTPANPVRMYPAD